jgi:omega-6 fatty acid desaturase (delta-12 desaturase)
MHPEEQKGLLQRIKEFSTPDNKVAAFEMGTTLVLFLGFFGLMLYGLTLSYWLPFILLPFTAVLVTRLFTIQHDCGHGSYFSSQKVNDVIGSLLGCLTLTPYYYWRKNHSVHHAFSGNLDKRGTGDVDTFTVSEYHSLPFLKKAWYRIYRNPAFMLIIAPLLLFGLKHRLPLDNPFHSVKSWTNIMLTNFGIAVTIFGMVQLFGAQAFFLVYLPVVWLGSSIGVALFYIQHQYEDAYWDKGNSWKYFDAGLQGSSYFEFPKIINWLINSINLHHIHHLNGHVPSYRLRECLTYIKELQTVPKRTLADIPACFKLALWDDENKKMVGFPGLETAATAAAAATA